MNSVPSGSVALVVTSPPYPMIEMWDAGFAEQDASVEDALARSDGWAAYQKMHRLLDSVWREVHRVLVDGGIACINIGDATRSVGESFALYPNHAHISTCLVELGFTPLPAILWRKPTNAPNKFMGSGMLPPGAYVTLEHEYILIVRKGNKREFQSAESKARRRESSFFWEERNQWFSDVWFDLPGTPQSLPGREKRERSGAFPFELPYRLINMFSLKGDTVLDPFLGTGTTMLAAMACERNSLGFERDESLAGAVVSSVDTVLELSRLRLQQRLDAHRDFVKKREADRGEFGYRNEHYGFPVVTRQETELVLSEARAVVSDGPLGFRVDHGAPPSRRRGSQCEPGLEERR